jgi:NADH-quinone oxidoreductase subunit L
VISGFWGIEPFLERMFHPTAPPHGSGGLDQVFAPFAHAPLAAMLGLMAVALGFSFAYALYARADSDPLPARLKALARGMRAGFYFDGLYAFLIRVTHDALARLADGVDRWIIAGVMVRGTHGTTELVGRALRLIQTGNLQTYVLAVVLGVAVVLWFALSL